MKYIQNDTRLLVLGNAKGLASWHISLKLEYHSNLAADWPDQFDFPTHADSRHLAYEEDESKLYAYLSHLFLQRIYDKL